MPTQITLNFEAGLAESYGSVRECIAALVHKQGKPQKVIAADMDYSPSDLSRKLAQAPNDSRRLTADDVELFIEVTGDLSPVYYFVEKYLIDGDDELDRLKKRIAYLEQEKGLREASR